MQNYANMPTVKIDINKPLIFILQLEKFNVKKQQTFTLETAQDIANWSTYFLYLLLDNICENRQHHYIIRTENCDAVEKRIKEYGKLYHRGISEYITVESEVN